MCAPGEQRKKKKKKTIRIEREINFNPKMSFLITNYPHGGCMWGRAERDIMFRVVIEKLINSNTFFFGRNLFWGGAQQSLEVQQPRDD